MQETLIISKEEAVKQGFSAGLLRVLANSIERLGRDWLKASHTGSNEEAKKHCKHRAAVDFSNARSLRMLAKEVEK